MWLKSISFSHSRPWLSQSCKVTSLLCTDCLTSLRMRKRTIESKDCNFTVQNRWSSRHSFKRFADNRRGYRVGIVRQRLRWSSKNTMHRYQMQLRYCSSLNLILCNGKDMSQNALRNYTWKSRHPRWSVDACGGPWERFALILGEGRLRPRPFQPWSRAQWYFVGI